MSKLTKEELQDLFNMIQYSTRKNIQYGDYLYDKIVKLNTKVTDGISKENES